MAGYIGSKAVSVNTTSATISDDLAVGDDLAVTGLATIGETLAVTGVLTTTAATVFNGGFAAGGVGTFADGSASAPSITNTGDLDTGIAFPAANSISIATAGTQRLIIDSAGFFDVTATGNDVARFSGANSGSITIRNDTANQVIMHTSTSDDLVFGTGGNNDRLTIDATGNVGIGGAPNVYTNYTSLAINHATNGGILDLELNGTVVGEFFIDSNGLHLYTPVSNDDISFKGNDDGGGQFTALTLDMSDAGTAIFNHDISLGDDQFIFLGAGQDMTLRGDGTNGIITTPNGNLTFDSASNIILDADNASIALKDDGVQVGSINMTNTDLQFVSEVNNRDMIFTGKDDGSFITALTFDMSDAGTAIFNNKIAIGGTPATDAGLTILAAEPAIMFHDSSGGGNDAAILVNSGVIAIRNGANGNNVSDLTERVRIDNSGNVGINNTTMANYTGGGSTKLVVGNNSGGSNGISIVAATDSQSSLCFTDTAGAGDGNDHVGLLQYVHSDNSMRIFTNTSEKFRIAANGDLTATDTSIASNSDERLKENISDYTYDVAKFKQYAPKTFDWKNADAHNGRTGNRGFVAQAVKAIDDKWIGEVNVSEDSLDYDIISDNVSLTSKLGEKDAMYISVIQQLIERIETLEG